MIVHNKPHIEREKPPVFVGYDWRTYVALWPLETVPKAIEAHEYNTIGVIKVESFCEGNRSPTGCAHAERERCRGVPVC